MTRDDLNSNYDIIYDHRNLILELKKLVIDIHGSRNDTTIYHTLYYYDEAGNRIRKMIYNNYNDSLLSDNIYSRDVSGRELAIYENGSIDQWNIYGMDNIGFIDGNEDIRFYMKDHLGSVRAVTDVSGNVVSSQDGACSRMLLAGDAWGYLLENRVYDSDVSVYKFTSKERDDESKYDYFGARYYDARVGRWGQIDPLFEKYITFSPYSYALANPMIFKDPNGKWTARYDEESGRIFVIAEENDNFEDLYAQLGLTSEEFFEEYRDYVNDPENFELGAGFELEVTKQVIGNAIFDSDQTNMNCFSACFAAIGLFNPEIQVKTEGINFANSLTTGFGLEAKSQIKTGYMKTFEDMEKVTHHAAIYVVRSQKGLEYYFGRPGPDSKLQVQTSDRLNQLYPDFKTYILSYPRSK
jgi:RHS repeat-associated protein